MLTVKQLIQLDLFKSCHILHITPLANGLSHHLYQLTYLDSHKTKQHCVLRFLRNSIDTVTADSHNEYQVMQLMYALGLGPNTIDFINVTEQIGQPYSLIVMDFIQADLALDITLTDVNINQLSHHLSTLHSLNISRLKLPSSPNSLTLLDDYWDIFTNKTTTNLKRFDNIKNALKDITFNNDCLIHGDLNFSNILINDDKMTWIDWEYASIGDAYFDYATLCVEAVDNIEDRLIKSLANNLSNPIHINKQRLTLFKLYYAATCWLWMPQVNADLYINQRNHYQLIVDKLLTDISL